MPLVFNTEPSPPPTSLIERKREYNSSDDNTIRDGNPNNISSDVSQVIFESSYEVGPPKDRAELIKRLKAKEARKWSLNTKKLDLTKQIDLQQNQDEDSNGPQSALHSGVFAPESTNRQLQHPPSPVAPSFHPALFNRHTQNENFPHYQYPPPTLHRQASQETIGRNRTRAQSVSSLSGYILKHPTSPLALSSQNDDSEGYSNPIDIWDSPVRQRRASLVPSLSSLHSSVASVSPAFPRHPTHVSRRSISDNWYDSSPIAPTHSRQASRRLSFGVGLGSDLPSGSFVGSYEESILNGRMSTAPSKPLQFLAQIGVLGLGKCKASLRCPTHITVPFPAYFYSFGDYDSPSPYVGQIDLDTTSQETKSSKSFKEGGYRIPQKGQLQIIIKNPNKTAVKLFLIPYDLLDMQPGTKTFLRQKSYCADAYTEKLKNKPPMTPITFREKEREALRYLIHLHICCPSKGRYYLHRNIKVVFANRVPDGKEKLRNEIQHPEPKYSPWKPNEGNTPTPGRRRRGSSISLSLAANGFMVDDGHQPTSSISEQQRFQNFKFGGSSNTFAMGRPVSTLAAGRAPHQTREEEEEEEDVTMTGTSPTNSTGGYDKISSSVYSNSSGRSESSQQGLLAMRLRSLDVLQFENTGHANINDGEVSPRDHNGNKVIDGPVN